MRAVLCIGRFLIVILNVVFVLCTVFILAGGLIIKFSSQLLKRFGQDKLDEIKTSVDSLFPGQAWHTDNWNLNDTLGNIAIFFIVAGAVLLVICILGFTASCCKVKCMLVSYAVIIGVLLLTQVVLLIVVYASPSALRTPVKNSLKGSLTNFIGLNGTNTNSITWNFMMRYFKCCGVINYLDFHDYDTWWGITEHVAPYACCVELPMSQTEADRCAGSSPILPIIFLTDSNYAMGCVEAVSNFIFVDNKLFIGLCTALAFLAQVLLIVFSVVLTKMDDSKVHPSDRDEYSLSRPPKIQEVHEVKNTRFDGKRTPVDQG